MPYGSLFFASAGAFEEQLPEISRDTRNSVVIMVLSMHTDLGSTMLDVLERYLEELKKHNSVLMLAGVDKDVMAQLRLTGLLRKIGRKNVFEKQEVIGEAGLAAHEAAMIWVEEHMEETAK